MPAMFRKPPEAYQEFPASCQHADSDADSDLAQVQRAKTCLPAHGR
jgi:hypothetical protein